MPASLHSSSVSFPCSGKRKVGARPTGVELKLNRKNQLDGSLTMLIGAQGKVASILRK
jgi:hypothetical protein